MVVPGAPIAMYHGDHASQTAECCWTVMIHTPSIAKHAARYVFQLGMMIFTCLLLPIVFTTPITITGACTVGPASHGVKVDICCCSCCNHHGSIAVGAWRCACWPRGGCPSGRPFIGCICHCTQSPAGTASTGVQRLYSLTSMSGSNACFSFMFLLTGFTTLIVLHLICNVTTTCNDNSYTTHTRQLLVCQQLHCECHTRSPL